MYASAAEESRRKSRRSESKVQVQAERVQQSPPQMLHGRAHCDNFAVSTSRIRRQTMYSDNLPGWVEDSLYKRRVKRAAVENESAGYEEEEETEDEAEDTQTGCSAEENTALWVISAKCQNLRPGIINATRTQFIAPVTTLICSSERFLHVFSRKCSKDAR